MIDRLEDIVYYEQGDIISKTREPNKEEIIEKINEIIDYVNRNVKDSYDY